MLLLERLFEDLSEVFDGFNWVTERFVEFDDVG